MNDAVPLLTDGELDDDILEKRYDPSYIRRPLGASQRSGHGQWSRVFYTGGLLVLWLSTAVISSGAWNYWLLSGGYKLLLNKAQMTFSPAQSEVEYLVQTFQQNISEVPVAFRDPDTADMAWDSLYNAGFRSKISTKEAMNIPNETLWVDGDSSTDTGGYIVTLSVFHELHCLDLIRHALEPHYGLKDNAATNLPLKRDSQKEDRLQTEKTVKSTRYADLQMSDLKDHLNHCVHSLRQAISCHSDISVGVWQRDHALSDYKPNFRTAHTCRNFERIKGWAASRAFGT